MLLRLTAGQFAARYLDKFDLLAVPGVSDIQVPCPVLNHCGIGKLAIGIFEGPKLLKVFAVIAHRDIQRSALGDGIVLDDGESAIAQAYRVDAGVGIRQRQGMGRGPR